MGEVTDDTQDDESDTNMETSSGDNFKGNEDNLDGGEYHTACHCHYCTERATADGLVSRGVIQCCPCDLCTKYGGGVPGAAEKAKRFKEAVAYNWRVGRAAAVPETGVDPDSDLEDLDFMDFSEFEDPTHPKYPWK